MNSLTLLRRNLSLNIKQLRKLAGLKQNELAVIANVSLRHLQDIETTRSDLKASSLAKISTALNIPSCFLINTHKSDTFLLKEVGLSCSRQLWDYVMVGVCVLNLRGQIVFKNPFCSHFFMSEIPSGNSHPVIWELIPDKIEATKLKDYFTTLANESKPDKCGVFKKSNKDGAHTSFLINSNCITDSEERVMGFVCTLSFIG